MNDEPIESNAQLPPDIALRPLQREKIPQIWTIDRAELIENIYELRDGELVLKPDYFDVTGWPPNEDEIYTPILLDCFDRGGSFSGLFYNDALIAIVVLESKFIGQNKDQLQLKFLYTSRDYRKQGLGTFLFKHAATQAKALGANKLYISATPSENTINFYTKLGCVVTQDIDPDLFALEPEDIHLEYTI